MAVSILHHPNQTFSLFKFSINHYFIFLANQNTVKSMDESFLQHYSLKLVKWNWNDFFNPRWCKFWSLSEWNGFQWIGRGSSFDQVLVPGYLATWLYFLLAPCICSWTNRSRTEQYLKVEQCRTTSSMDFVSVLISLIADVCSVSTCFWMTLCCQIFVRNRWKRFGWEALSRYGFYCKL